MNLTIKITKIFFYFVRKLNQVAQQNRKRHELYAYWAFPIVMGLLITFLTIRIGTSLWPNLTISVNGLHVHHFVSGIFTLIISGYIAFWVQSHKIKYITALAYGSGLGLIFDEFYVWLRLDGSIISHSEYDAVVTAATILLAVILLPWGIHGLYNLFKKNGVDSLNKNSPLNYNGDK